MSEKLPQTLWCSINNLRLLSFVSIVTYRPQLSTDTQWISRLMVAPSSVKCSLWRMLASHGPVRDNLWPSPIFLMLLISLFSSRLSYGWFGTLNPTHQSIFIFLLIPSLSSTAEVSSFERDNCLIDFSFPLLNSFKSPPPPDHDYHRCRKNKGHIALHFRDRSCVLNERVSCKLKKQFNPGNYTSSTALNIKKNFSSVAIWLPRLTQTKQGFSATLCVNVG